MSWTTVALPDAFWFQEGPGLRNWQFHTEGIKILNVGNIMPNGSIDLSRTDRHVSIDEFEAKYKHFSVDDGDLVIASSGISFDDDGFLRTKVGFIESHHLPLCMNTSTIRFKAKDGISYLPFLKHWFQAHDFRQQVSQLVTGSAQLNFGPSHLKAMSIQLPPLNEQKRIAGILDQADALRRLRTRALDKLNTFGQAIFHEMFGDLVSNRAESGAVHLSELIAVRSGFAFKSDDFSDEGCPIVRISNFDGDHVSLDKCARVPLAMLGRGEKFEVFQGDLLIAMSGATTGKTGLVPTIGERAFLNQRVGKYEILDSGIFDPTFLRFLIRTDAYLGLALIGAWGAAQPNVSGKQLVDMYISLPSMRDQTLFAGRIERVWLNAAIARSACDRADALFASLQHRAFRGEL